MEEICICVIADLHVNIPYKKAKRMNRLQQAISNLTKHEEVDAVCILGDISDQGLRCQQRCVIKEIHKIKEKQVLLALGNHDIFHYLPSVTSIFYDLNYLRSLLSLPPQSKIYEEFWIQDVPILVLGSEQRLQTDCFLSPTQCEWIKERLERYRELPYICICSHQPLTNTHLGSEQLGLGEQDTIIKRLLRPYSNVIWISAHVHTTAKDTHVLQSNYGILLDTPSFALPRKKHARCGCGALLHLCDTHIQFDIWDFLSNKCLQSTIIKKSDSTSDL